MDVMRHPKMFATDVRGPNEGPPVLERWLLDPAGGKVRREMLSDHEQEFPRLHEGLIGRRHRYGYGAEFITGPEGLRLGSLLKHDVERVTTELHENTADLVALPARMPVDPPLEPMATHGSGAQGPFRQKGPTALIPKSCRR